MINHLLHRAEKTNHGPVIPLDPFLSKTGYFSKLMLSILTKFILVKMTTHTYKPIYLLFVKPTDLFFVFYFPISNYFHEESSLGKMFSYANKMLSEKLVILLKSLVFNEKRKKKLFLKQIFLVKQCHFLILFLRQQTNKLVFIKSECFPDNNICVPGNQETHNRSKL